MKKILCLGFASLMLMILFVPTVSAQNGPLIDVLRLQVGDMFVGMLVGAVDVAPSFSVALDLCPVPEAEADKLLTTSQLETLAGLGDTVMQDLAFHVGFIGYNIRDTATIQSYYRPGITYWPLADVGFRHALIHNFDQLGILAPLYGYTVTPVRSLVPPAQGRFYNSAVEAHPYNPGSPFTSPPWEHSACGILKDAGYTFVDQGVLGVVDAPDFWRCPDGYPVPRLKIMVPFGCGSSVSSHPSSQEEEYQPRQFAEEFVADLASVGLASTAANGYLGFEVQLVDFETYLATSVFGRYPGSGPPAAQFDAFMCFFDFGELPSQLYSFCHNSQDVLPHPGRRNAVGMNNATIDSLVETVKYSLDPNDIEYAAKKVCEMLYDPELPGADGFALAYMCLYSKTHFNVYDPNLGGIVKSHGYGSDNKWTFLNIHWTTTPRIEGTKTVVIWALPYGPSTLNPLDAPDSYGSEILEQVYDGLTNKNPYNQYDISWIATSWSVEETIGGMEIDYTIRNDVKWQDGKPLTASDIEWCLEFIRDRHVPKYAEAWQALTDVLVTSPTTFTIICNKASISLFYDFNGLAALLPRHIWDRPWINDGAVLNYDPTEAYNVAPGYTPGPTPPPTNLFGTGPFVFQFYDFVSQYSDLWRNSNYFMSQAAVATMMTQMFWEVGDHNRNGLINVQDLIAVSFAFGYTIGSPGYDPNADFNSDGIVDMRDMRTCAYHLLWLAEHP